MKPKNVRVVARPLDNLPPVGEAVSMGYGDDLHTPPGIDCAADVNRRRVVTAMAGACRPSYFSSKRSWSVVAPRMVFSSYLFVFYLLPLALGAYYLAPLRVRNFVLTAFSYLFYGWANPLFLFLLLGSTLLDYTSGLLIAQSEGERIGGE